MFNYQIQEIDPFGGSFTIFNECGKLTMKRSALGNRLLIKLVSNYDELTSKGFELNLRGNNLPLFFGIKKRFEKFFLSRK